MSRRRDTCLSLSKFTCGTPIPPLLRSLRSLHQLCRHRDRYPDPSVTRFRNLGQWGEVVFFQDAFFRMASFSKHLATRFRVVEVPGDGAESDVLRWMPALRRRQTNSLSSRPQPMKDSLKPLTLMTSSVQSACCSL